MLPIITAVLAAAALPFFLLARPAFGAPTVVAVALPADLDALDNDQDTQAIKDSLAALEDIPNDEKASAGANFIYVERKVEDPDMSKSNVYTSPRKRWGWGGGGGGRNCCGCRQGW